MTPPPPMLPFQTNYVSKLVGKFINYKVPHGHTKATPTSLFFFFQFRLLFLRIRQFCMAALESGWGRY
jgi:hypothetical protein